MSSNRPDRPPEGGFRYSDQPVWTVVTPDGGTVDCRLRFAADGIEAVVTGSNGETLTQALFSSGAEAADWADDAREEWLGRVGSAFLE